MLTKIVHRSLTDQMLNVKAEMEIINPGLQTEACVKVPTTAAPVVIPHRLKMTCKKQFWCLLFVVEA